MVAAVCTLLLATATVPCLYYAVLYAVGRCRRHATSPADPLYLTVLIPAHDEAGQLPHTLRSLAAADYPASHLRVLVVADNCTDSTAAVAKLHGASVITRTDAAHHGKGYALAFGLPHAVAGCDAGIVLDADCTVNRDFLRRMSDALRHAEAVQAAYISRPVAGSPVGYVAAVGCAIDNAVSAGGDRLGLPVPLRGTGMGFRRELLARHPWRAFGPTEDAEYSAALGRGRVRVRFLPDAHVYCHPPADGPAFGVQRRRWTAALRVHPLGLLGSKPLVLAHLLLVALAVFALSPSAPLVGWLLALLALTAALYTSAAVPLGWPSPRVLNVVGRLLVLAVVGGPTDRWDRTPRP
jgi:cellulose synthase/poly-beta-1,6-N-acetylglucosamine synthase-like glycosyltransferase